MIWSHDDLWMLTADHGGFVKYWQSNMNNVKMYQAHRDPIRGLRLDILRTAVADGVSTAMLDIQACFFGVAAARDYTVCNRLVFCSIRDSCFDVSYIVDCCKSQLLASDRCLQRLTLLRDSIGSVVAMLSLKAVFNKTGLVFQKRETYPIKTNNSVS